MSISTKSDNTSTLSAADEIVDIDQTFYVLIPSRFPPIEIFQRISNDRHDEIAEIESRTNPRLREKARLLNGIAPVDVDSPLLQNWNHAPFTYPHPEGSRFLDANSSALELAEDLQTALAISVAKRERFLRRTSEIAIGLDMRVLSRRVRGRFLDSLSLPYDSTREELLSTGARALNLAVDGILYRPPERPTARCAAIMKGAALDRAIQGDHFKFMWDGTRIASLYSFTSGKIIDPEVLRQAAPIAGT